MGMSQQAVIDFLKERAPNKYTTAQIIYHLKSKSLSESVIYANLKRLKESKQIKWVCSEIANRNGNYIKYWYMDYT